MVAICRLALPFTDTDLPSGNRSVVVNNGSSDFTVTLDLPSANTTYGYYNGGPLVTGGSPGSGDTDNTSPAASLAMALAEKIAAHGSGFRVLVTEDSDLAGRYIFTRQGGGSWSIKWGDSSTTMDPAFLGFTAATFSSSVAAITATHQAARLWIATRPSWFTPWVHRPSTFTDTVGGAVFKRGSTTNFRRWRLGFSLEPGAKLSTWYAGHDVFYVGVANMAKGDPNVPLEGLWSYAARRTPFWFVPDDSDMSDEYYLEVDDGETLHSVNTLLGRDDGKKNHWSIELRMRDYTAGSTTPSAPSVGALDTYGSYGGLPSSASNGDIAAVTTTPQQEVYQYVASVGGDDVGMWLPWRIAQRIDDYVRDGSANPAKISCGIEGDDKSALTSRGWSDTSTASGSAADATNAIRITGAAGGGGSLTFTLSAGDMEGLFFSVVEVDQRAKGVGGVSGGEVSYESTTGEEWGHGFCFSTENEHCIQDNATSQRGSGDPQYSAFERVFCLFMMDDGSAADRHKLIWSPSKGWDDASDYVAATSYAFGAGAANRIFVVAHGGGANEFDIRELHVFSLT